MGVGAGAGAGAGAGVGVGVRACTWVCGGRGAAPGHTCLASFSRCFRSSRMVSSVYRVLMKVLATPGGWAEGGSSRAAEGWRVLTPTLVLHGGELLHVQQSQGLCPVHAMPAAVARRGRGRGLDAQALLTGHDEAGSYTTALSTHTGSGCHAGRHTTRPKNLTQALGRPFFLTLSLTHTLTLTLILTLTR